MSLSFGTSQWCKFPSATFLDAKTKLSFYMRFSFHTIVTADQQFVFRHRNGGSGDQIGLRKDGGTDRLKATVTGGGISFRTVDSPGAVTAGQIIDLMLTYEQGIAQGFKLYMDGSGVVDDDSTTTHTIQYNTSGGDLAIAAIPTGSNWGKIRIERFCCAGGVIWTQTHFDALRRGHYATKINMPRPDVFYPMWSQDASRIVDFSGNGRHIEGANVIGPPTSYPFLGQWQTVDEWSGGAHRGAGGVPAPNPWIQWTPDVNAPVSATVITGLVNGTVYELKATHLDADGNESTDSAIVEATPSAPAPPAPTTPIPWRRSRRFSKYRPSQQ